MSKARLIKTAHSKQTDNHKIKNKIALREMGTAGLRNLRVLDCFAGENVIWSFFDCEKYYGIELEHGKGRNLNADNRKVLPSLDLSQFNVIDLDSYGIPVEQIELIFKNPTLQKGTVVFYTAIGSAMSSLSTSLAKRYGLSRMLKLNKVLFNSLSNDLFKAFLYDNGVRTVFEYTLQENFKKEYGFFIV